jgi:hypothetical protein
VSADDAPLAGAWAEDPGFLAFRAAVPEVRVGVDAPGAQGFAGSAPVDGAHRVAGAAPPPAVLAAIAPRQAGGPGDLAGLLATADRAGQHGAVPAGLTEGPPGSTGRHASWRSGPGRRAGLQEFRQGHCPAAAETSGREDPRCPGPDQLVDEAQHRRRRQRRSNSRWSSSSSRSWGSCLRIAGTARSRVRRWLAVQMRKERIR